MAELDLRQALEARRPCPLWVRVILFGSYTRSKAIGMFWLGVALVPAMVAYGFVDWRVWPFSAFQCFLVLWHAMSIRWVDRHKCWP